MKKSAILVAVGALFAGSAYAQSSVTLYGIVDATIHYTTNANANGNSLVRLDNGAVSNSRWGLKGNEDLGGGNKALFVLESGFDPDTGRANGGGLFNRQAFVGLSNKDLGTITLGRQYNFGFTMGGNFDPLGVGNYDENSWIYYGVTGLRVSNMLKYEGKWSGLYVGLGYGFGEQAGSAADNRYMGGAVSYEFGPAMVGAFYQQQQDAPNALTGNQGGHKQKVWGIGGNYAVGPAKLYAGYIDSSDNTACVNSTTTCAGDRSTFGLNLYGNAAGAGLTPGATKRRDRIGLVGVTYQATPALALTGAFYYDSIKDAALAAGADGKRYTGVLLAEYSLSKRTQLYGTVAYDKVKDAAAPELPGGTANGQNGKTNQVGVGLGIRHIL